MRTGEAKELFRQLTASYFREAEVIFGRQSRTAKSALPLVSLTPGNVTRPEYPVSKFAAGWSLSFYPSQLQITVDLFTHGRPVTDHGVTVAYEDCAVEDLLGFADFLGSQHAVEWCRKHDAAISTDGRVLDLTGAVNDSSYEYRAQMNVTFSFTQMTVGHAAVLPEGSVLYPHDRDEWMQWKAEWRREHPDETDSEDPYLPENDPDVLVDPDDPDRVYAPVPPMETESTVGESRPPDADADTYFREVTVRPKKDGASPSGGGGGDLEDEDQYIGWFSEAEIKRRKSDEQEL